MPRKYLLFLSLLAAICCQGSVFAQSRDLAPLLATLRKVEREGQGNQAATKAWAELTSQATAADLPVILISIDDAGPLAANWLRAAVDAIAERHVQSKETLPIADLEKYLKERQHDGRARRLAFEWLVRNDPTAADRLIPAMIDDPSLELRRDAVARVLDAADKALAAEKNDVALATYRQALDAARDLDQVKSTTEALKKLGHPVDLAHHYGFLQDWKLIGPFDNRQGKGFDTAYPVEAAIDFAAEYPAAVGTLRWISHHTDDENGYVDLNKAIGKQMGAAAYAVAEFNSDRQQPAELRLGSENANKIWLNAALISMAEVYHANGAMDQYIGRGELKAGRNIILLKICQNEQKEEWAQDWKYQLRVCDSAGKAILAVDRPPARDLKDQTEAQLSKEEPK